MATCCRRERQSECRKCRQTGRQAAVFRLLLRRRRMRRTIAQECGATQHTERSEMEDSRTHVVCHTDPGSPSIRNLPEAHKERSLACAALLPCSASCLSWYVTQSPGKEMALRSRLFCWLPTQQLCPTQIIELLETQCDFAPSSCVRYKETLRTRAGRDFSPLQLNELQKILQAFC